MTKGRQRRMSSKLRSASEPSNHSTMSCTSVGLGARLIANEVSALASAESATPARMRVRLPAPRRAIRYSTRVASAAQPIAVAGSSQGLSCAMPKYRHSTAPRLALELTPSSPGSASGLRSRPCSAAPDMPSDMPTRMASSTRGRRISVTMACWRTSTSLSPPALDPASLPGSKAAATSLTASSTGPMVSDTSARVSRINASAPFSASARIPVALMAAVARVGLRSLPRPRSVASCCSPSRCCPCV